MCLLNGISGVRTHTRSRVIGERQVVRALAQATRHPSNGAPAEILNDTREFNLADRAALVKFGTRERSAARG